MNKIKLPWKVKQSHSTKHAFNFGLFIVGVILHCPDHLFTLMFWILTLWTEAIDGLARISTVIMFVGMTYAAP